VSRAKIWRDEPCPEWYCVDMALHVILMEKYGTIHPKWCKTCKGTGRKLSPREERIYSVTDPDGRILVFLMDTKAGD